MAWSKYQIRMHDPSLSRRERLAWRIRYGVRFVLKTLGIFIAGWIVVGAVIVFYFGMPVAVVALFD